MNKEQIADYIVYLLKPLAPEVAVTTQVDDLGTLYTIQIAEENKGKVIGKAGATAKAIREIVRLVGYQAQIRASIKIV